MYKLTTEEIMRLVEVNDYVVKRLEELFESIGDYRLKLKLGLKIWDSNFLYLMEFVDSIYEIMTRDLDNSEANGTAKGKSLSTKEEI